MKFNDPFYPPRQAKQDKIDTVLEKQANEIYKILDYVKANFNDADYEDWIKNIKDNL